MHSRTTGAHSRKSTHKPLKEFIKKSPNKKQQLDFILSRNNSILFSKSATSTPQASKIKTENHSSNSDKSDEIMTSIEDISSELDNNYLFFKMAFGRKSQRYIPDPKTPCILYCSLVECDESVNYQKCNDEHDEIPQKSLLNLSNNETSSSEEFVYNEHKDPNFNLSKVLWKNNLNEKKKFEDIYHCCSSVYLEKPKDNLSTIKNDKKCLKKIKEPLSDTVGKYEISSSETHSARTDTLEISSFPSITISSTLKSNSTIEQKTLCSKKNLERKKITSQLFKPFYLKSTNNYPSFLKQHSKKCLSNIQRSKSIISSNHEKLKNNIIGEGQMNKRSATFHMNNHKRNDLEILKLKKTYTSVFLTKKENSLVLKNLKSLKTNKISIISPFDELKKLWNNSNPRHFTIENSVCLNHYEEESSNIVKIDKESIDKAFKVEPEKRIQSLESLINSEKECEMLFFNSNDNESLKTTISLKKCSSSNLNIAQDAKDKVTHSFERTSEKNEKVNAKQVESLHNKESLNTKSLKNVTSKIKLIWSTVKLPQDKTSKLDNKTFESTKSNNFDVCSHFPKLKKCKSTMLYNTPQCTDLPKYSQLSTFDSFMTIKPRIRSCVSSHHEHQPNKNASHNDNDTINTLTQWKEKNKIAPDKKIFLGQCPVAIRKALLQRGWLENPDVLSPFFNLRWLAGSIVVNKTEGFFKDKVHNNKVQFSLCNRRSYKVLNQFKFTLCLTTKSGLAKSLQDNLLFFTDKSIDEIFPKSFNFNEASEIKEFIKYFKLYQAACVLKLRLLWWIAKNSDASEFINFRSEKYTISNFSGFTKDAENFTTVNLQKQPRNIKSLESCLAFLSNKIVKCAIYVVKRFCITFHQLHFDIDYISEKEWEILKKVDMAKLLEINEDFIFLDLNQVLETLKNFADSKKENNSFEVDSITLEAVEALKKLQNKKPYQFYCSGGINVWIIKPANKSRGRGIELHQSLEQISKYFSTSLSSSHFVCQKYIEQPYLIKNKKFDIRQWVCITSWNPLTVWFYKSSYLRFTVEDYNLKLLNKFQHLTNYSITKDHKNFSNTDIEGNMWSSEQLEEYLKDLYGKNIWRDVIQPQMKQIVLDVAFCVQEEIDNRSNTSHIFGFDFLIDERLHVWLLEVNSCPDMSYSTNVTKKLVKSCLEDLLKVILDWKEMPTSKRSTVDTGNFQLLYQGKTFHSLTKIWNRDKLVIRGYSVKAKTQN